jgi:hypothetical protein
MAVYAAFDNIRELISDYLDKSESSIHVAVAWITDHALYNQLVEKARRGKQVEVILSNTRINHESRIDYNELEVAGGHLILAGSDSDLMHQKFCVIDAEIVISGSYNWTNKAHLYNHEFVTVHEDAGTVALQFLEEFQRLKHQYGKGAFVLDGLSQEEAIKLMEAIKALISLGDSSMLNRYILKLATSNEEEVLDILNHLNQADYPKAITAIDSYKKSRQQVTIHSVAEKQFLSLQIPMLEAQIMALEADKSEMERIVHQYHHRFAIEVYPLLLQVLHFKRKIADRFKEYGFTDNPYKDAEKDYEQVKDELEEESHEPVVKLSGDDQADLKSCYYKASKLCHPDLVSEELKAKATEIQASLNDAYQRNDLQQVKQILYNLENGIFSFDKQASKNDLEILRAKFLQLKEKLRMLIIKNAEIKRSDTYRTIESLVDWDAYFEENKQSLRDELENLIKTYGKQKEAQTL